MVGKLVKQKGHFAAALAGVAFAVTLMLSQIGLRDSLLATAVRLYSRLNAGHRHDRLANISFREERGTFPARRIDRLLRSRVCVPVRAHMGCCHLKNPLKPREHPNAFGVSIPRMTCFSLKENPGFLSGLDDALLRQYSRSMYGPVAAAGAAIKGRLRVEASRHEVNIRRTVRLIVMRVKQAYGLLGVCLVRPGD